MAPRPPQPETIYQLQFPSDAVSFDAEKFDELIRSQGVEMVHWRAMRCPVGMVDPDDIRRPHEHHQDCSNGFLYTLAGTITCGFLSNSSDVRFIDAGRLDGSTVQVVLPRFYDDKPDTHTDFAEFDRVYLKEEGLTVTTWHTFEAHVTGVDRLQFPAVHVVDLVDADGARYAECVDFCVKNGQIHWGDRRPGVDAKSGRGKVCSVRFSYRPFWYVKSLPHQVRVAQIEDEFGDRRVERMPQSAVLQREYHFEKEQRDSQTTDPEQRQKAGPADGFFGRR